MADPWELICHHTYSGLPGVVVDQSPARRSHAAVVGLSDGDFLTDGVAPGSGAVSFFKPGARLRVPPSESWQPLGAVTGEVTIIREPPPPGSPPIGFLVDSGSFQFYVRGSGLVAWFNAAPQQYAEISTHTDAITPRTVPTGQWVTLGFLHDGTGMMELSIDGEVVARRSGPLWPVNPAGAVTIGNSADGQSVLFGRIDDLKIWRRNPRQVAEDFLNRPMDDATADCWVRFGRALAEALRRHPQCAGQVVTALRSTVDGLLRDATNKGPETRERLRRSADRYRTLWQAGQLDSADMTAILTEMNTWMDLVGLPVSGNPGVQSLQDSTCLAVLRRELAGLECDPQFNALWRSFVQAVQPPDAGLVRPI